MSSIEKKSKSLALVIPWFGNDFPYYFDFWLKTASYNNWLVF